MKRHAHRQASARSQHDRAAAPAEHAARERPGVVDPRPRQVQLDDKKPGGQRHGAHGDVATMHRLRRVGRRSVGQHDRKCGHRGGQCRRQRGGEGRGQRQADLAMQAEHGKPQPGPQSDAKNGRTGYAPVAAFRDRRAPGRRVAASNAANVVSPVLTHANSSSAIWKSLCMRARSARPRSTPGLVWRRG